MDITKLAEAFEKSAKQSLHHINCGGKVIYDPQYFDPEIPDYICTKCGDRCGVEEIGDKKEPEALELFSVVVIVPLPALELQVGDKISDYAVKISPTNKSKFVMTVNKKLVENRMRRLEIIEALKTNKNHFRKV